MNPIKTAIEIEENNIDNRVLRASERRPITRTEKSRSFALGQFSRDVGAPPYRPFVAPWPRPKMPGES